MDRIFKFLSNKIRGSALFLCIFVFFRISSHAQAISAMNVKVDHYSCEQQCQDSIKLDTIKTDSTFSCSVDTCTWSYTEKVETTFVQFGCLYSYQIYLKFDLFDARNSDIIISEGKIANGMSGRTYQEFPVDSIKGDVLTKPGYGRQIAMFVKTSWPSILHVKFMAKRADGSDSASVSFARWSNPFSHVRPSINVRNFHPALPATRIESCFANGRISNASNNSFALKKGRCIYGRLKW